MKSSFAENAHSVRIVRFPEMQRRVGYCRMHIDRLEKDGKFPKRVRIGANAVGWVESEIDDWLSEKLAQRGASTLVNVTQPRAVA